MGFYWPKKWSFCSISGLKTDVSKEKSSLWDGPKLKKDKKLAKKCKLSSSVPLVSIVEWVTHIPRIGKYGIKISGRLNQHSVATCKRFAFALYLYTYCCLSYNTLLPWTRAGPILMSLWAGCKNNIISMELTVCIAAPQIVQKQ